MTALKNDTALYDLIVEVQSIKFLSFSGAMRDVGGLPAGSIFNTAETTDVRLVYAFLWTPEAGQEGVWQVGEQSFKLTRTD